MSAPRDHRWTDCWCDECWAYWAEVEDSEMELYDLDDVTAEFGIVVES